MKSSYALVGLAALLTAGSAHAGLQPGNAIYSSFVTNLPDQANNASFPLATGALGVAGSPLAQQFNISGPTTLASLDFRLSDATAATDGGSIQVYLVPNSGTLPLTTGTPNQLAVTTLLATISDSSLPVNGVGGCAFGGAGAAIDTCNTMVSVNDFIATPGNYWIALVNGSDANNGGTNPNSSSALWWRSGDNIGLNAAGLTNAHVNLGDVLTSQVAPIGNAFEMQVNTPEPASLALLGLGMTGLGCVRRRGTKNSAC